MLDPAAIAPIARLMSVGDVVLRNDLQFERYDLVRPEPLWRLLDQPPPEGIGDADGLRQDSPGRRCTTRCIDEQALGAAAEREVRRRSRVFPVEDAPPIVRARSRTRRSVVVAATARGSSTSPASACSTSDTSSSTPARSLATPRGLRARDRDARRVLVVTDSNRQRARRGARSATTSATRSGPARRRS